MYSKHLQWHSCTLIKFKAKWFIPSLFKIAHSLSQSGQAIYSLPKSAKRSIPCAALLSLNGSTVIIAAAELLLITKKEGSYEIIENPTPYVWDKYSGHDNAISIRISCVSCADCFWCANQIRSIRVEDSFNSWFELCFEFRVQCGFDRKCKNKCNFTADRL